MNHMIATLSAEGSDNWAICKQAQLWGTSAKASHAKKAVRVAEDGDRIFVWQSTVGLIASAEISGVPFEFGSVADVPWPRPETYKYGIRLAGIRELDEPIADPFDDYASRRFGVQTYQLQSGLAVLKPEQAMALSEAVDGSARSTAGVAAVAVPAPPTAAPEPSTALAAAYLLPASSVAEALLALYRQNRSAAESGELVLIGPEELRPEFERERRRPPFDELGDRVSFVTTGQLEQRLRSLNP